MSETNYVIKSKLGYWNHEAREWANSVYGATWYCSEPFADGQAEVLREKYCTKTWLAVIY